MCSDIKVLLKHILLCQKYFFFPWKKKRNRKTPKLTNKMKCKISSNDITSKEVENLGF